VNRVLLLVMFLWTFNDFNTPFILFGGNEPPAGDLISVHIYNTTESSRTLAVGLGEYSTEVNVYWNQIMAASLVVSVPVVIGFLLLQRSFVAGLSAGAVK
jgi:ABC-type glycerol-3-phosphate transport system permease component